MFDVSCIVDATSISPKICDGLVSHIDIAKKLGLEVEIILFTNKPPSFPIPPKLKLARALPQNVRGINVAVAQACSQVLLFAPAANLLADTDCHIFIQATTSSGHNLRIPFNRHKYQRIIGMARLLMIPYYFTTKDFAATNIGVIDQPQQLIKIANKQLSLGYVDSISINFPINLVRSFFVYRPSFRIAKRLYLKKIQAIKSYFAARKADKLRRQVPDVNFSSDIPIFIVCRDRVEPLKKLVRWCEDESMTNIYFIDNNSTYPPLLRYYDESPYEVIRLGANIGHTSPWVCGAVKIFASNQPFIVTDPDVIPDKNAHGAVKLFCRLLTDHPERTKVGFGLKIDDLPDQYDLKDHVIAWERQFWVSTVEPDVYDAEIDTTFALYRQNTPYTMGPALRTGGKYVARHEPWYTDSSRPSDEMVYYRKHANKTIGSWGADKSEIANAYSSHLSHIRTAGH